MTGEEWVSKKIDKTLIVACIEMYFRLSLNWKQTNSFIAFDIITHFITKRFSHSKNFQTKKIFKLGLKVFLAVHVVVIVCVERKLNFYNFGISNFFIFLWINFYVKFCFKLKLFSFSLNEVLWGFFKGGG